MSKLLDATITDLRSLLAVATLRAERGNYGTIFPDAKGLDTIIRQFREMEEAGFLRPHPRCACSTCRPKIVEYLKFLSEETKDEVA